MSGADRTKPLSDRRTRNSRHPMSACSAGKCSSRSSMDVRMPNASAPSAGTRVPSCWSSDVPGEDQYMGPAGAEFTTSWCLLLASACVRGGGRDMKRRTVASAATIVLCLGVTMLGLPAAVAGSAPAVTKPRPSPSPSPSPSPAPSGTFATAYSAIVNGSPLNLTPEDVQATSDGGYIALAVTGSSAGLGVNWLVKLNATGTPQWQEQVGCASPQGAPGDYADGVSVQQTADGGYVVAGGAIDCGSGSSCPPLSGRSCALVEKLDAAGKLTWARVYAAGPDGSAISQIRQAADGGYIAAGSFTDASQNTGALLLKLDSAGNVQWQKDLGPAGSTGASFNTVQPTTDGGYVAAGNYYTPTGGPAPTQVLVA